MAYKGLWRVRGERVVGHCTDKFLGRRKKWGERKIGEKNTVRERSFFFVQ